MKKKTTEPFYSFSLSLSLSLTHKYTRTYLFTEMQITNKLEAQWEFTYFKEKQLKNFL